MYFSINKIVGTVRANWLQQINSLFSLSLGSYQYGGKDYKASAPPSGSSLSGCRRTVLKALKVNESTCTHMKCTFGGVWNGGGGDGQKNLFVASFFFDRAAEVRLRSPMKTCLGVTPKTGFCSKNVKEGENSGNTFGEKTLKSCFEKQEF